MCLLPFSPAFLAPDLRRKMTAKAVTIVAEGESAGNDFRRAAVRSASVPKQVRIRTDKVTRTEGRFSVCWKHLRCQDKCGARLVSLHIIPSPKAFSFISLVVSADQRDRDGNTYMEKYCWCTI